MRKSTTSIRKLMLSGIVFVCGMAGTVQAETLFSGIVYGGPDQTRVACEVVNMSDDPITFVKKELIGHFNGVLTLDFDDCGASLAKNSICTFQAATPTHEGTACKVVIVQKKKTGVHGTMVALTGPPAAPFPLSESDLR
jgi:hypothetical protein